MKLRVSFVVLAILSTVLTILMCAKYPTGPNTISLDKPVELWSAIGTMVAMALPALILCFFNYMTTRIISSILQIIAVPVWALLALIAFFMENYWIGVTATISSILIIISVFVTLIVDSSKQKTTSTN